MAEERRRERKVVTVLFADVVGFTARSEELDPEDVEAFLAPYHARVKAELERFGGTVEKFIGDAVMALFGAPAAHEDDPERAVRAALAIRDWAHDEAVELRIGIATGTALITLSARAAAGETLAAGDVVNTAARLQTAAPVNAILVGEQTFRATQQVIEYREVEPVDAKGKSAPVPAWEALEATSSFGVDVRQHGRAPLVGRDDELAVLVAALSRARRQREPQLVTLVGVPGIGKSRLVWELFQRVEHDQELVRWRQGRCLPYGDGVSLWALGEMVKAEAGILETDAEEEAEQKLARVSGDPWVLRHLRPLLGLGVESDGAAETREDAFAAWRRFFEDLAEERPTVLVFEDLHWADDDVLDFVDHLVEWTSGVPLLAVGTARPELLVRRPAWGGGKSNAQTLSLSPLSEEETARLVHALVASPVLESDLQSSLLERAGGNPLYAEEFVRLLEERGDSAALPETVHGIIAARLDALPRNEKALLQDGAVLGKVFWRGAAAAIGESDPAALDDALHALERKEFLRRERRASVGEETEYVFRHAVVRDVAYEQIPRASRAQKHVAAAQWIEALGRPDDHAELVAQHYLAALELLRSSAAGTAAIEEPARIALRRAGDRAVALSAFAAAARYYGAALELWPADEADRAALLLAAGNARYHADGTGEAELVAARDAFLAQRDGVGAAEAEAGLSAYWWRRGVRARAWEHIDAAVELIRDAPPSRAKAHVLTVHAGTLMVAGERSRAEETAREALAIAEPLELDDLRLQLLTTLGGCHEPLDPRGFELIEQAIELGKRLNTHRVLRAYANLSTRYLVAGDLTKSEELVREGLQTARRFGESSDTRWLRGSAALRPFMRGRWDEALAQLDAFIAECEAQPHYLESAAREARAFIRLGRGDEAGALEDSARGAVLGRAAGDPQAFHTGLAHRAFVLAEAGELEAAAEPADELLTLWGARPADTPTLGADFLALALAHLGRAHELLPLVGRRSLDVPWAQGWVLLARRDYLEAAALYERIGFVPGEALSRLRAAEQLLAEGRRAEADAQLARSLPLWRSMGATKYVREGEALLAAAS